MLMGHIFIPVCWRCHISFHRYMSYKKAMSVPFTIIVQTEGINFMSSEAQEGSVECYYFGMTHFSNDSFLIYFLVHIFLVGRGLRIFLC